jgi:hypothetical protein
LQANAGGVGDMLYWNGLFPNSYTTRN